MDRVINYPGQIPLETDLLRTNRNIMVAIGKMAHALFGTSTIVNGLTVTQDTPASMRVAVGPGEIYALANLDSTAYSSLPADTARQVVKQGVNLDTTFLTLAAPGTAGQSINYLIQATLTEVDLLPTVLPYYNSGNPAVAFSGPNNTGQPQATERDVIVTLSAKAGAAAATGSQQTPSPDANYVGLYVVTVANGQSSITNAHISLFPGAPILPSAGMVRGGFQNNQFSAATAGGTADAITANFNPQVTAVADGMTLFVRASAANTSTAPTFAPGSLPARAIVKGNNLPLLASDIAGAGHWLEMTYDSTLDKWVLLNPAFGASASIGVGQTWQNVTGSRAAGTTYYNTTVRPIQVLVALPDTSSGAPTVTINVGGTNIITTMTYDTSSLFGTAIPSFIVPPGASYSVTLGGTLGAIASWCELR